MNITTTPALVLAAAIEPGDVQNTGTSVVFINSTADTCTPALGLQLNPGDAWYGRGPVFACVATGTGTVAVMVSGA